MSDAQPRGSTREIKSDITATTEKKRPRAPPAPQLPPPRPRKKKLSAAVEAAITRAERAFLELPVPRPYSRKAQVETYNRWRQLFIDTMKRAGMTTGQIRARLGAVTRRRNYFWGTRVRKSEAERLKGVTYDRERLKAEMRNMEVRELIEILDALVREREDGLRSGSKS